MILITPFLERIIGDCYKYRNVLADYPVSKSMLPTIAIPNAIITIGTIILAPLKFSTFDMEALGGVFYNLSE